MSPLINLEALASLIAKEMRDHGLAVQSRLFDLESAAVYLCMTPEALKTKALQGKVPSVRIDKKWRFDRVDLDQMIDDHKEVA
jgi:hypothetical protein